MHSIVHIGGCARVRTEQVPWTRPRARYTRDLEDLVAFMVQCMDKTEITRLLRVSWSAAASIIVGVVADQLDEARLEGLYRIGIDEVSGGKDNATSPGWQTTTAEERSSGAGQGRSAAIVASFLGEVVAERSAKLLKGLAPPRDPLAIL